ncbi:MAG TPA: bestrophin [Xanthomonadaceae bacterium]|nr:bestrophin [Xanthomonadaceae bacterium]
MILRPRPTGWQLLYILRGSIVPAVAPKVLAIFVLAVGVSALGELWHPVGIERVSVAPFSLVGLVLTIFLSFRNNACHERWWEGRKQWGQLIVETRSLARECATLMPGDATLRTRMLRNAIGFAHALAARLRGKDMQTVARPWIDDAQALASRQNTPDLLLTRISADLAAAHRAGAIDSILYGVLEQRVTAMAGIQAACERIAGTPLPFAYTLLLHRCAWLFCVLLPFGLATTLGWATPVVSAVLAYAFFGLDQLGDETEEPFGTEPNDLPLDAIVRTIEIDLLDSLGVRPLPEPLQPRGYQLT